MYCKIYSIAPTKKHFLNIAPENIGIRYIPSINVSILFLFFLEICLQNHFAPYSVGEIYYALRW